MLALTVECVRGIGSGPKDVSPVLVRAVPLHGRVHVRGWGAPPAVALLELGGSRETFSTSSFISLSCSFQQMQQAKNKDHWQQRTMFGR